MLFTSEQIQNAVDVLKVHEGDELKDVIEILSKQKEAVESKEKAEQAIFNLAKESAWRFKDSELGGYYADFKNTIKVLGDTADDEIAKKAAIDRMNAGLKRYVYKGIEK